MRPSFRCALALALALMVPMACAGAGAVEGPSPPCGAAPVPPYPESAHMAPLYRLWQSRDLGGRWTPPACTGLAGDEFTELVALAGRLDGADLDAVLARMGAVSTLAGIRYWSVRDARWEVLITRAAALDGPDPARPRPDFTAADLESGRDLYFVERENRVSADVVYRLRLDRLGPDRARITVENASPVERFFVPLLGPGALASVYFLERGTDGAWNVYSLLRVGREAALMGWFVRQDSYVNRAVAFYRHMAGLPTDQDPPARP